MIEDICNLKLPKGFRFKIEVYSQEEVDKYSRMFVFIVDEEDTVRRKRNLVTRDFCLHSTVDLQQVVDAMIKEFQ